MKFHEYRTMQMAHPQPSARLLSAEDFFDGMVKEHSREMGANANDFAVVQSLWNERLWRRNRRPFYNVYPAVIKCLLNTRLSFCVSNLGFSLPVTAICFPVECEPKIENRKVSSVLFGISQDTLHLQTEDDSGVWSASVEQKKGMPCFFIRANFMDEVNGRSERIIFSVKDTPIDSWGLEDNTNIVALCVGIAMLARDEKFAEEILLARDEGKVFATEESRQAAIRRARNRGRNGMAIGKDIDTSPHVRRPHFGIRWTEKGRAVPKLVPISGSLVSRSKLYPIPTGHLDD
jgi:hypothetical protein